MLKIIVFKSYKPEDYIMKPSEQYSFEISTIRHDVELLKNSKIYELQNSTHYPSAYKLGSRIEKKLNDLLYAIDNQLPGKAQELRDSKDCVDTHVESEQANKGD